MAKIKVYIENGAVFVGTTATDLSSTFSGVRPLALNTYPADGFLTASVVDTTKVKVVTSDNKVIFTGQTPSDIVQKNGSTIYNSVAATAVTALNAIFDTPVIESFVVKDPNSNNSGTTKLRHKAGTGGADRDEAGTVELDTHSASIGLYDSFLKISETDLSNTGGKTAAYGDFRLDLQNASGSAATAMRIVMGNVYQQAVGDFNFATLDISGSTTFSSSTGTVTFDGDTSGIDYGDLANVPSTFAPASHNHAASEITSGTFATARIPGLGSSKITSGTLADARISQSSVTQHQASLTITESQISDLAHYADASVNTHLNQSSASSGQYLKWTGSDYAWGTISSGGLGNVVEDTSPQLGGPLDVNGQNITSASNGDVTIDPAGTGAIVLKSDNIKFEGAGTVTMSSLKFYEALALEGNYVALKAPLSISNDVTWTLPAADGTSNQVIKTDGSGTLSFTTVVNTQNPLMQGTVSIQQVAGLSAKLKIFDDDTSHGVVLQAPDLTADVTFTLPATDGSSGQVLKTDGSGNLSFVAQTADTNTNIANTSLALNADRTVDSDGNTLTLDPNGGGVRILESGASTPYINCEQGALELNGINFPGSDGTSGQVLQTNGSGSLSFATVSGGGGLSETPLVQVSGRFQWSSTDSEERVHIGSNSYGPFNWYNFTSEPSDTNLRNYSAGTVDSTTAYVVDYHPVSYGIYVPGVSKKVKVRVSYRIQNGNAKDFGFSLWDCPVPANGSTSNNTVTLRAQSATTTATTDTTKIYTQEFTTTSAVSDKYLFFLAESRSDELNGTTYVYANISFSLVD